MPLARRQVLTSHTRRGRAGNLEPMAPDWPVMNAGPLPVQPRTVTLGGRCKNDMQAAKRGKRPRITRPPIAESDGRTGSIGTIAYGESRDATASAIDILPLDLGIFAHLTDPRCPSQTEITLSNELNTE